MTTSLGGKRGVSIASLGIVIAVVAVVVFSAAYLVPSPQRASSTGRLTPATGSSQQWAFGGAASSTFSCSGKSCFPANVTFNGTISLSWKYYIEWVVIYTQTNVSSTQTMIEGQAALNASASFALSECIPNGTSGAPCTSVSASLGLSGKETALGFTNITNGTVNMTSSSSSPLGSTPALAIQNAASDESFNFSGSYSVTAPTGSGGPVRSESVAFVIGATESSSVAFTTPLGVVPINPKPGDTWSSSAPFTANGAWTSGYSFSVSGYSSASESNWTKGTVSPSGTLGVTGTDLGQFTLYDNYTNPPTTVTAQEILLDFGNGSFAATDGWVMVPVGLYGGIFTGLGLGASHGPSHPVAEARPASSNLTSLSSGESAYYQRGVGFIGAQVTGNASIPVGTSGTTAPSVKLSAGPEPVSVAEQQYQAITANAAASSSFAWTWLILAVVVVVVVLLGVVLLMRRRSRGRRPAAMTPAATSPMDAAPGGGAPGGGPPTMAPVSSTTPPSPASPAGAAAVVCPTCGQPATYIAQYGRNYCYNERKYL
jgi:hypothetical protein